MSANTGIEWTDSTWSPIRARVRDDAGAIAERKGYGSLVQVATKTQGRIGHHCEHVSPECERCYSETMQARCLRQNGTGLPFDRRSRDLIEPFMDEVILAQPLHWRAPRKIFVESQSDLFGEWVPDEMIDRTFAVMALCQRHTFQVLTKRAERMLEYFGTPRIVEVYNDDWKVVLSFEQGSIRWTTTALKTNADGRSFPLPNVWLGVSAGNAVAKNRIDILRDCPAAVRFLSIEPLLEDVGDLNLDGIDWVIVGGESGPGARPMPPEWARSIRDQCVAAGVAFHFKQWGEWSPVGDASKHQSLDVPVGDGTHHRMFRVGKKQAGRELDVRTWDELPGAVSVQSIAQHRSPSEGAQGVEEALGVR